MIGKTLGHYCIVEKISEGGMGVVWRTLFAAVAGDPDRISRFEKDARNLANSVARLAAEFG